MSSYFKGFTKDKPHPWMPATGTEGHCELCGLMKENAIHATSRLISGYWWATFNPYLPDHAPCIWGKNHADCNPDPGEDTIRVFVSEVSHTTFEVIDALARGIRDIDIDSDSTPTMSVNDVRGWFVKYALAHEGTERENIADEIADFIDMQRRVL